MIKAKEAREFSEYNSALIQMRIKINKEREQKNKSDFKKRESKLWKESQIKNISIAN